MKTTFIRMLSQGKVLFQGVCPIAIVKDVVKILLDSYHDKDYEIQVNDY